jgi:quinol-cytochrome oxidoreductase complex cytochrome b subunit
MRPSFFHHLHPPTIPAAQARFRYTLGLGGLSIYMVLVLIVTGALLMFFYVPTPAGAAASVQTLAFLVPYGALIRNLHYWSAQLLLAFVFFHLVRVLFTGAFTKPRRVNYLLGLGLLVLALLLDFTGYVLRWDEGVHWALVTGTNLIRSIPLAGGAFYRLIVGGDSPGGQTLIRFYAWHIFGLTLILIAIGVWHLFRVRRDGGIAVPPPYRRGNPDRISRDELARREVLALLVSTILLLLLGAFVPAPIAPSMDPSTSISVDARAPWFFLWIQQLLRQGNPFLFGVLIPALVLLSLAGIPFLFRIKDPGEIGKWFPKGNYGPQIWMVLLVFAWLVLTLMALAPDIPLP